MLVSAISAWITCKYTYVPSLLKLHPTSHSHLSRLSQSTRLSSLCYTTAAHWLSVLYIVMFMFQCYSLNLFHSLFLPLCPQVQSLQLHLYFCPANRFISTIFLDSVSSVQSPSRVWLFAAPWTAGFPVHHQLLEFTQTHIHWVSDAIQPAHPLSSPSCSAFDLSQHQGLFQWVSSLHQVAKVLELQLQHQSFQWIFMTYFL